jgi:genome maintenance exonuclease 1
MSIPFVRRYDYPTLERNTQANGTRHYTCPQTGKPLASVTTVLDQTSDKSGLLEWRKRVGDKEADRIKHEAVGLGSLMHTHLEHYVGGLPRPGGTNLVRQQAEAMADQIIEYGLNQIDEWWGSEVALYYPALWGGTCDLVGVYKGQPAIIDFKSARKMKKREHIENYLIQTAAYGIAHNELYETNIKTGVIFMVDRDFNFQEFLLEGDDFRAMSDAWFDRLEQYYAAKPVAME